MGISVVLLTNFYNFHIALFIKSASFLSDYENIIILDWGAGDRFLEADRSAAIPQIIFDASWNQLRDQQFEKLF